jgi:predicted alpha/beta hydrolase
VAHSWGGVLLLAWMARFAKGVTFGPAVFFASKRRIGVVNLHRLFMVDAVWSLAGIVATAAKGYLPAKSMGMGSENEPAAFYRQVNRWVYSKNWKDASDGFDYKAALRDTALPPLLYFTGKADKVMGHPKDVRRLMEEAGAEIAKFVLLGKAEGNLHDYGHIDLLTSKDCPVDHFPMAVEWLRGAKVN